MGGLHRFMSWDRLILTDFRRIPGVESGRSQSSGPEGVRFRSHLDGSAHLFTPELCMDVQLALGSDIVMVSTSRSSTRQRPDAEAAVELSLAQTLRIASTASTGGGANPPCSYRQGSTPTCGPAAWRVRGII
jgi:queuine tRNA-ribosyltransferase